MRTDPNQLRVKIFADGADRAQMLELYENPLIKGFTTNPTLMRKAGINDYEAFARDLLDTIVDRPISFEVFSDDFADMERQGLKISSWGDNVYVKIPVTDTRGDRSDDVIKRLTQQGVKVNVTALMTLDQVKWVTDSIEGGPPAFISIFAGRIADTGRDPVPLMSEAVELARPAGNAELIWASPREVLNILQADAVGCHIITATHDVLKKLPTLGKDLEEFSLDTVKMFHSDSTAAGYSV
ncbi:MAG: transaldolase [Acidimicrobiia bacterium]|nr:transaldolase [Acidimicrobiia bacterium]